MDDESERSGVQWTVCLLLLAAVPAVGCGPRGDGDDGGTSQRDTGTSMNCDGEGVETYYRDNDGDNYGNPMQSQKGCSPPPGYVKNDEDCDDADGSIHPDAEEVCDGRDNDCDGEVDNPSGDETCACTEGETRECGKSTGRCQKGTQQCVDGEFGACTGQTKPQPEVCDGKDNDCDGETDEELTQKCAKQLGVCSGATVACQGGSYPSCGKAQYGGDYETGAETKCDNKDNDCDGTVDEGVETECPLQTGVCSGATVACKNGSPQSCGKAEYGSDYEPKEQSGSDNRDNDCDGRVDNHVYTTQFGTSGSDEVADLVFEPSSGVIYAATEHHRNGFVEKFSMRLDSKWASKLSKNHLTDPRSIAYHSSGLYTGGQLTVTNPRELDVDKWNFSGRRLWDASVSASRDTLIYDVGVNPSNGDVYGIGFTKTRLHGQPHSRQTDMLLMAWDKDGARKFTRVVGGASDEHGLDLAVDPTNGDIYLAGLTRSARFAGKTNPGGVSSWVMRYDASGSRKWTRLFGDELSNSARGVAYDSQRKAVYVVGSTKGKIGNHQPTDFGNDGYLLRYSRSGVRRWVAIFSPSDAGTLSAVEVAGSSGHIYTVGESKGDFGGISNKGDYDIAVLKFDPSGTRLWTRHEGTMADDDAVGLAVDPNTDDVYVSGSTEGSFPNHTNRGGIGDAYLMRLKE